MIVRDRFTQQKTKEENTVKNTVHIYGNTIFVTMLKRRILKTEDIDLLTYLHTDLSELADYFYKSESRFQYQVSQISFGRIMRTGIGLQ